MAKKPPHNIDPSAETVDEDDDTIAEPSPADLSDDLVDGTDSEPLDISDEDEDFRAEPTRALAPIKSRAVERVDSLQVYMNQIRRYPLLSREEEHDLAVRFIETGDPEAGRKLIISNLRLVVKIAHEYKRAHRNLLDLVQEGNLGLVQAVQKFDPYRGVKLSSYAAWWIRAYMLKFILANWRLVKVGTTQAQRKLFFNLSKERAKLAQMGFDVTPKALAQALSVSEQDVIDMEQRLDHNEVSLDAPLPGEGRTGAQVDLLPEDASVQPDNMMEGEEFRDLLRTKLETFSRTLEGRELAIFKERLLNDSPKTLQEIGDQYQISRERARQLEQRLTKKLKAYLQTELGDAVQVAMGLES